MYQEGEKINIIKESDVNAKGKPTPKGWGITLDYGEANGRGLQEAISGYKREVGVWVRPNPMDGQGVGHKNVTSFRHCVIECDEMPINDQFCLMKALKLPYSVLLHSGGKSLHALVRVDAGSIVEYKNKFAKIVEVCAQNGLIVDKQNSNACRLSRFVGVDRGADTQRIIDLNVSPTRFEDWLKWIEEEAKMEKERLELEDPKNKEILNLQLHAIKKELRNKTTPTTTKESIKKGLELREKLEEKIINIEDIESSKDDLKSFDEFWDEINEKEDLYKIEILSGLYIAKGAFSVVAAPTKHGKTTVLNNVTWFNIKRGCNVLMLTQEESPKKIRKKITKIAIGKNPSKEAAFNCWDIMNSNLDIRRITGGQLTRLEDTIIKENYDLVLIDYLQILPQLINSNLPLSAPRNDKMQELCLHLMKISINTNTPILSAAQFNREGSLNPELTNESMIKDASDIEQASNVIIGVWNTSKRFHKSKGKKGEFLPEELQNKLYVTVLKDRDFIMKGDDEKLYLIGDDRRNILETDESLEYAMKETREQIKNAFLGEVTLFKDFSQQEVIHEKKARKVYGCDDDPDGAEEITGGF